MTASSIDDFSYCTSNDSADVFLTFSIFYQFLNLLTSRGYAAYVTDKFNNFLFLSDGTKFSNMLRQTCHADHARYCVTLHSCVNYDLAIIGKV